MLSTIVEISTDHGDYEVYVTDICARKGYPAYTSGLPEDCYEGEDDELDFLVEDIIFCTEDGSEETLLQFEIDEFMNEHGDAVSEKIWAELRAEADDF